jgi:beta-1,4-mannosyltransferase
MSRTPGLLSISSFPNPFPGNPYLTLLYSSLEEFDCSYVQSGYFGQEWLRENSGAIDYLHFHWVGGYYENAKGKNSFLRLAEFLGKLWFARLLGYRIIWTAHNLYPHNRQRDWKSWLFRFLFVHSVNIVFVNFEKARNDFARIFKRRSGVFVIAHGNYRTTYPEIPSQDDSRKALGLADHEFVYFLFGGISPYKGPHTAIRSFATFDSAEARLVIKGQCLLPHYVEQLKGMAESDRRIDLQLGLDDVADPEVCQWMSAIDCVVAPYEDIYTSGMVYLAATFGKPMIAPRLGVCAELENEGFMFLYDPARVDKELTECMARVLRANREEIAKAATRFADRHEWSDIAREAASILKADHDRGQG